LGGLGGALAGSVQQFVAERNLFVKGIAFHLDVQGPIAGEEGTAGGRETAKAAPRNELAPEAFGQGHRRVDNVGNFRRRGQEGVGLRAAEVVSGEVVGGRGGGGCRITFLGHERWQGVHGSGQAEGD